MRFEVLISDNATVTDTVKLILDTINQESNSEFVKKLAHNLNPEGPKINYLHRLFNYVCKEVDYERDPIGHEKVTKPYRLIELGKGDCKKMTVLIASVLKNIGVDPLIKLVSYDGQVWEHIYVIVPMQYQGKGYVTLDPVNKCQFNKEFSHRNAQVYKLNGEQMKLSLLGAMPNNQNTLSETMVSGISEMDDLIGAMAVPGYSTQPVPTEDQLLDELAYKTQEAIIATRGKGVLIDPIIATRGKGGETVYVTQQASSETAIGRLRIRNPFKGVFKSGRVNGGGLKGAVKTIGLAPARGAFIAILLVNALKMATKLAAGWNKNPQAIANLWIKLGGDPAKLRSAIERGSKQVLLAGKNSRVQVGIGSFSLAALITTATPIIIAITQLLKQIGIVNASDNSTENEAIKDMENTSESGDDELELPSDEDDQDDEKKKNNAWMGWAAGGLLALKLLA